MIKVREDGETHHRARPLAERAQGDTTVLLKCSPPPIRLGQGQEHIHRATGVGVQLTQRGRGLRQEVVELPDETQRTHRHNADACEARVQGDVYTGSFSPKQHPRLIRDKRPPIRGDSQFLLAVFNLPGKSALSI